MNATPVNSTRESSSASSFHSSLMAGHAGGLLSREVLVRVYAALPVDGAQLAADTQRVRLVEHQLGTRRRLQAASNASASARHAKACEGLEAALHRARATLHRLVQHAFELRVAALTATATNHRRVLKSFVEMCPNPFDAPTPSVDLVPVPSALGEHARRTHALQECEEALATATAAAAEEAATWAARVAARQAQAQARAAAVLESRLVTNAAAAGPVSASAQHARPTLRHHSNSTIADPATVSAIANAHENKLQSGAGAGWAVGSGLSLEGEARERVPQAAGLSVYLAGLRASIEDENHLAAFLPSHARLALTDPTPRCHPDHVFRGVPLPALTTRVELRPLGESRGGGGLPLPIQKKRRAGSGSGSGSGSANPLPAPAAGLLQYTGLIATCEYAFSSSAQAESALHPDPDRIVTSSTDPRFPRPHSARGGGGLQRGADELKNCRMRSAAVRANNQKSLHGHDQNTFITHRHPDALDDTRSAPGRLSYAATLLPDQLRLQIDPDPTLARVGGSGTTAPPGSAAACRARTEEGERSRPTPRRKVPLDWRCRDLRELCAELHLPPAVPPTPPADKVSSAARSAARARALARSRLQLKRGQLLNGAGAVLSIIDEQAYENFYKLRESEGCETETKDPFAQPLQFPGFESPHDKSRRMRYMLAACAQPAIGRPRPSRRSFPPAEPSVDPSGATSRAIGALVLSLAPPGLEMSAQAAILGSSADLPEFDAGSVRGGFARALKEKELPPSCAAAGKNESWPTPPNSAPASLAARARPARPVLVSSFGNVTDPGSLWAAKES